MSMKTTPWKQWKEGNRRYRMRVTYGMDYAFARRNNQAPYFSITGEIQSGGARGGKWRDESFGTLHDDIAWRFPGFRSLLPFHLMSTEGPMHYLANAKYWWEKYIGRSKWSRGLGEPDPLEAFKRTILFGALPDDKNVKPRRVKWSKVEPWLKARLPLLIDVFHKKMSALGVLE